MPSKPSFAAEIDAPEERIHDLPQHGQRLPLALVDRGLLQLRRAAAPAAVTSDRLREAYERRAAEQYSEAWQPRPEDRKFARVWALVQRHLPCAAFLDAGCGDGRYLAALASTGNPPKRIVGTDISQRVLETARVAAAPLEPELIRANLEDLPFGNGEFDVVLCSQVIEHLLDVDAGLRELARVLGRDGTLILTTDNARNLVTRALFLGRLDRERGFDFPHRAFDADELRARVLAAGLEVAQTETFRFHAPRRVAQRALNRLDELLPRHGFGDILAVVARKP
jgi:SAM-dependent methyltransferase